MSFYLIILFLCAIGDLLYIFICLFMLYMLQPDAILVRSAGVLQQLTAMGGAGAFSTQANCTIPPLRGDFSLNVANAIAAGIFLENGLERVTPTHDLNADQIVSLAEQLGQAGDGAGTKSLECILHQHLAIFHTEHCVFCRFLSTGNNYTNCGHPCERDSVKLRSMEGEDHLVLADQGCRNTVFNAKCQTGAEFIPQFVSSGIEHFRVELVDERPEHVAPLLSQYRRMLLSAHKNPTDTKTQQTQVAEFYEWLDKLPDSNGRAQGHDVGSLKPAAERQWSKMKLTAHQEEELKMSSKSKSNTKK